MTNGTSDQDFLRAFEDCTLPFEQWKHRAHVKVASGSDAGFMLEHGRTNSGEIELLVEGGYSPLEALCAATATGADILEIDAGRLVEGKLADIVLVDGDPLADMTILREPKNLQVFKGGRAVLAPAA